MKKKTKQMLILLLVLVLCIAVYLIATAIARHSEEKQAEEEAAAVIHVGNLGAPTEMTIFNGTDTMSFLKEESGWVYQENPEFPLNTTLVDTVANAVSGLTSSFRIEMQEDVSAYGLDNPMYTLSAADADGNTVEIQVGGAYGRAMHYASISGEEEIYTLSNEFVDYLATGLNGYYVPDSLPALSEDSISSIQVSNGKSQLTLQRLASENGSQANEDGTTSSVYNWYVVNGGQKTSIYDYSTAAIRELGQGAASDYITAMISSIGGLKFSQCAAYQPDSGMIGQLGLKDPQVSITVEYTTGTDDAGNSITESYTIELGGAFETTNEKGQTVYYFYAALEKENAIFTISSDYVSAIIAVSQYCID